MQHSINTPLKESDLLKLSVGDLVLLTGKIYTARDAAHKKLKELIEKGDFDLFELNGAVIYYCGPTPAPPGRVIGSAGPTTSYRMDPYVPLLLSKGVKGFIGKGKRSIEVKVSLSKFKGIYFIATGGAGALLSTKVKSSKLIAFPDLGPEAIYELEVENFPLIVGIDFEGNDIYEIGPEEARKLISQANTL
ncbi:MAG: FumA C-terminus/TtdB family hydratase beta subunit [candidate division WOR-3 bacterium]